MPLVTLLQNPSDKDSEDCFKTRKDIVPQLLWSVLNRLDAFDSAQQYYIIYAQLYTKSVSLISRFVV